MPPCRYVFHGAEVYDETSSSDDEQTPEDANDTDSSSDDEPASPKAPIDIEADKADPTSTLPLASTTTAPENPLASPGKFPPAPSSPAQSEDISLAIQRLVEGTG